MTDGERSTLHPFCPLLSGFLLALHLPNPDPPHVLPRDKGMKDEGGPNAEERDGYQYEGKERF